MDGGRADRYATECHDAKESCNVAIVVVIASTVTRNRFTC